MMKKSLMLACILTFALVGTASAEQVYPKAKLNEWNRENVAGGTGPLYGNFAFVRTDAPAGDAIKEAGWMTLKPGGSVGLHKHEVNEEVYIIVSGEGLFMSTDGTETKVAAGDIAMCRKGESHGLKNTGKEDLVFIGVVAQQ